jgi:hypothetical protein
MNNISKQILNLFAACLLIAVLLPQNALITSAATNAMVYEYSPMLEDNGNIFYIQRVEGKVNTYNIYRLEVSTGKKTKLISSENDILDMMIHNDTLYYISYVSDKDIYQTYSVSIDAKDKKTICNGYAVYLDDSSIYYTVMKGEKNKLYKQDYESKKDMLIYTGNLSFSFVKNLGETLYFTQFIEASSKLTLYTLAPEEQVKLTVLTTEKIKLDGTEREYPTVSDIVKINGDIYYQYGTYEGSGSYWYGTLKKIDTKANKKSVIVEQIYEDQIFHNDSSIFYNGLESSEKRFQYNTKTGKTSTYTYKTTGSESFNILGDKTYCAKADGEKLITVSSFTSGAIKKNKTELLMSIPYKQKKELDYSASVSKYGDYLLIPVTCVDYNDTTYGWRGKMISINWYVADMNGKVLAQFK